MAKWKKMAEWVFAGPVKSRWKRVLTAAVILILTIVLSIGSTIILVTNIGYNKKDGFHWIPWKVEVNYNKGGQ